MYYVVKIKQTLTEGIKMKDNGLIFLALVKVFNIDINDFRYRFTTGRLMRDGEICRIINEKMQDAICSMYRGFDLAKSFEDISIEELKTKNWLNRNTIAKAKKIKECYDNNILLL